MRDKIKAFQQTYISTNSIDKIGERIYLLDKLSVPAPPRKIQGEQKLKNRIDVLLIPLVNRSNIVMYEKRRGIPRDADRSKDRTNGFTGDDFSNWPRCRAESRLAINLCTTVVLDASYVTGTGQAGRFILNDIKKQAGDLCAQIVLSPCCSSTDLRRGAAGPRNTEAMHRLFTFCRHLIAPTPLPPRVLQYLLH